VRVRAEYRFSSLVKYFTFPLLFFKEEKSYDVFYFAGKRIFFYIYDVIISPEKEKKRTSIHY